MEIEYIKFDPTKNITVLVKTPVERAMQSEIAEKIMAEDSECEQVGFIEKCGSGIRLQMMGGEFCGNATMSFAALMAEKTGLSSFKGAVEISGADAPVGVSVEKVLDGYAGHVSMPLPIDCDMHSFERYTLPVVRFPGIAHAISAKPMPVALAEMVIRQWAKEINADALGIMLLSEDMNRLTPIVYVRSTDTVVRESSCASGTAAAAVWRAFDSKASADVTFSEPGGILSAQARYDNGAISALTLSGNVRVTGSGTLKID